MPSLALWGGLLVCVLQGFSSQLSLWRLLTQTNFWFYPRFAFSDQAVYHRLEKEGSALLQNLFNLITQLLHARLQPYVGRELAPFASAVYALDETTLDQVARSLPSLRPIPPGDSRLLPGKLAADFVGPHGFPCPYPELLVLASLNLSRIILLITIRISRL